MRVRNVIWREGTEEKIEAKHEVTRGEVMAVLHGKPWIRFVEKGVVDLEDLYVAFGRTSEGRYLAVYFIRKSARDVQIVTARDMDKKERRLYARH